MKVIFLDIDGVLNSEQYFIKRGKRKSSGKLDYYLHEFDDEAIKVFNKIIDNTNAKIVVSSSWRILFDIEQLKEIFILKNIKGEIIGITDHLSTFRGTEVQSYLNIHKDIDKFCIIDDENGMEHLEDYLVKTSWKIGLEEKHIEMVENMLK